MRLHQRSHTGTVEQAAYEIDDVAPISVVRPATVDDLCEEIAAANRDGVAVFPWGGGARMCLGNPPQRPGMVVDTTALNRVVSHNSGDMTATFQAGATLRTVSEVLAQAGQLLAIDPPLPMKATIGGTLASGASGPAKWQFGHLRDTVIGMKVVQPDGRITKSGGQVVKNVSGYDMSRLHIGGLGSLGLILEASFKLTPIPMYESTDRREIPHPEPGDAVRYGRVQFTRYAARHHRVQRRGRRRHRDRRETGHVPSDQAGRKTEDAGPAGGRGDDGVPVF